MSYDGIHELLAPFFLVMVGGGSLDFCRLKFFCQLVILCHSLFVNGDVLERDCGSAVCGRASDHCADGEVPRVIERRPEAPGYDAEGHAVLPHGLDVLQPFEKVTCGQGGHGAEDVG